MFKFVRNRHSKPQRIKQRPSAGSPTRSVLRSLIEATTFETRREPKPYLLQSHRVPSRVIQRINRLPLPLLDLRQRRKLNRTPKYLKHQLRNVLVQSGHVRQHESSHCQKRSNRRRTLFSSGVAGHNKRNSPGRYGTYIKNELSDVSCKRR